MGDYFQHWVNVGKAAKDQDKLPKIFYVNWFRKDENNAELPGGFMWPGYGDNSRVLAWIFDRCNGVDNAVETAIGYMPKEGAINTEGLPEYYKKTLPQILTVDTEGWLKECKDIRENHYPKFGSHLPKDAYNRKTVKKNCTTVQFFRFIHKNSSERALRATLSACLDDLEARLKK